MKLSDRLENGVAILEPSGKIMGGSDSTLLHEKLHEHIENGVKHVVIDLSGVDWVNSTGLGILIAGLSTMKSNNGRLKLANVTEKIKSLLTITKLVTVFESHETVEEAVAAFDK